MPRVAAVCPFPSLERRLTTKSSKDFMRNDSHSPCFALKFRDTPNMLHLQCPQYCRLFTLGYTCLAPHAAPTLLLLTVLHSRIQLTALSVSERRPNGLRDSSAESSIFPHQLFTAHLPLQEDEPEEQEEDEPEWDSQGSARERTA
ncbi:hypothetical protein DFH09DRAFT_1302538 [Mycena vulgaris]|nr:hypothetical protein DFH09DRAFT_1307782 [Mycena vulgaris]KAJ6601250.1 hypothetical protein DFH09DRAFT_1302538 [Mycena vulgaris]